MRLMDLAILKKKEKLRGFEEEEGWKGEKEVFLFKSESKKRSPMTSRITSCKQSSTVKKNYSINVSL